MAFKRVFQGKFGSQVGRFVHVLADKMALMHVFSSQEGTPVHVLAPKSARKCVFWLQKGHFSKKFGSQETTFLCFGSQEAT